MAFLQTVYGLIMTVTLKDLVSKMEEFDSDMDISALDISPTLRFSNTGKRTGYKKKFDISIVALKSIFEDIKNNLTDFKAIEVYNEKKWRDTGAAKFTDSAANALCTVQTLPLYVVINKMICVVNNLPFIEREMELEVDYIDNVLACLDSMITPLANSTVTNVSLAIKSTSKTNHISPGENIIYFGAPGTGKSHVIDTKVDADNSIRTVFHSETYYSDFVGSLKPTMGVSGIEYIYQVGPFTEILIKSLNDPTHHYYLVIEEINRAKSAAVFGELFQLLDRAENGKSCYSIKLTDQDLIRVYQSNLKIPLLDNRLIIPENLTIYATMNSSDQAVEPLDTAFKRRWKFVYRPIDFSTSAIGNFSIRLSSSEDKQISWKDLALKINKIFSELEIPEDRHLGPWFIQTNEIDSLDKAKKTLKNKIFMYLWDDVLRHHDKSVIFSSNIKTFGDLISMLDNDNIIFSDSFCDSLKSV